MPKESLCKTCVFSWIAKGFYADETEKEVTFAKCMISGTMLGFDVIIDTCNRRFKGGKTTYHDPSFKDYEKEVEAKEQSTPTIEDPKSFDPKI